VYVSSLWNTAIPVVPELMIVSLYFHNSNPEIAKALIA